jgi:hypothetical protein
VRANEGMEVPPVAVRPWEGATQCTSSSSSTAPRGRGIDAAITLSSDREDGHVKRVMRDKLG